MSYSHRIQRRKRKRRARHLRIAAAMAGVFAIATTVGVVQLMDRSTSSGSGPTETASGAALRRLDRPATGKPLRVSTPEGYSYTLEGIGGGSRADLGAGGTAAAGRSYAYVEYVMTNSGPQRARLDFPPDLFMKRSLVPAVARNRCIPRVGAAKDMCALPSRSEIVAAIGGSGSPVKDEVGDTYLPAGASYIVRAVMEFPVAQALSRDDVAMYVWAVRFTGDRLARPVPFPG